MNSKNLKANLINGEWVTASDGQQNLNPSEPADVIGEFSRADEAQVSTAVEAAADSLDAWKNSSPQVRADILETVGTRLIQEKDRIGRLLSREEGKTLAEGVGETVRAGQIFKFYAQEALRVSGDAVASLRPGVDAEVVREALGVVGIITPWNFPIAIPAWKIAPALAYGNTVVFKPAELTPACAHVLAKLLADAGIPAGVFNLVMGSGSLVGKALTENPTVDGISFTGSVPVGRQIARASLETMKKIQLEMGGKNPMVVLADADLNLAVEVSINAAFFSTGQRCTAASRLIVQASVFDEFVEKLSAAMSSLRIGNALDPATQIGPVVSRQQLDSNLSYVDVARGEASDVLGGEKLDLPGSGYFQSPALFVGTSNDAVTSREEIFGPCASVIKASDFDEAVAIANDTKFGLCAGICTTSLRHATNFKKLSATGMVMVNLPTAGVDYHVPFGGRKASSYGPREQGHYAADFYTTVKTNYTFAG